MVAKKTTLSHNLTTILNRRNSPGHDAFGEKIRLSLNFSMKA